MAGIAINTIEASIVASQVYRDNLEFSTAIRLLERGLNVGNADIEQHARLKAFAAARGLDLPALLAAAGLEPTMRAEEVGVAGFVALAQAAAGPAAILY